MSEAIVYQGSPEGTTEKELLQKGALIESDAKQLVIRNDEEYGEAAEFAKTIAARKKIVTDYFAPMKKAAHDAHKQVCDRETQALAPLKSAEQMCKRAMGAYQMKKQEEARRQEAELRRLAQEEANKKLAEAMSHESAGNEQAAQEAMSQAIVADQMGASVYVSGSAPKVKGGSSSKDYEIVSIDDRLVPIDVNGAVIRPVDQAAIKRLIKASGGKIEIPGVVYRETVSISVSGR